MSSISPDTNPDKNPDHDLTPPKVTRFTDSDGVLLYVKLVVKSPCKMLALVFSVCIIVTILLATIVFAEGNPITDGDSEFDIYDERSVAYNSLDFASIQTDGERDRAKAAGIDAVPPLRQADGGEFTYWIYEARSSRGVFTPSGLSLLQKAEGIFTGNSLWRDWCLLEYNNTDSTQPATCRTPLSALTVFAASEWDSAKVTSIMERLDATVPDIRAEAFESLGVAGAPTGTTIFNLFSFCVKLGVQCNPNLVFFTTMTVPELAVGRAYAEALEVDLLAVTTKWDGAGPLSTKTDEVQLFCAYMMTLPAYAFNVDFFFDKEFSKANPVTMYSRSIIQWGTPIVNPKTNQLFEVDEDSSGFDANPEDVVRKDFILDVLFDDMDRVAQTGYNGDVNAYYFMGVLIFDVFIQVLLNDLFLAIASISVVFIYMRIMLSSWFLAAVGMAEIIFSIPIAWFIAVGILQIKYFSGLNPMCLFIVAAIGADDIFVFMDAFKQSASKGPLVNASLETRMTWTYRRAGLAMLITSATTCSAFLACTISRIASTQSFGIFAALVIAMDYALVMTLFCTAVILFHNRFEVSSKNPCIECGLCCGCNGCCAPDIPLSSRSTAKAQRGDEKTLADDRITAFYKGPITNFVLNKTARMITFACFAVWLGIALYFMLQLEPTKTAEQFLDEDHPLQKALTILNEEFPVATDDIGASIYYAWGVADVDRSGVNQLLNPGDIGSPVFVDDWTFNPVCQQKVLDLCNDFRTNPRYDKHVKDDEAGFGTISCFVMELEDWTQGGRAGGSASGAAFPRACARPPTGFDTFPVPLEDVSAAMADFTEILSCTENYELVTIIETYQDARGNSANPSHIGWDGEKLKYVAISVESSVLDPFSLIAEDLARVEYDFFIALSKEIDEEMGEACGPVMMTDMSQKFIFMNNQRLYRTSAAQGALLGCVIALVVIWIATKSLPIALTSTFSILCVLISVVGSVTMIGWTLGTTTSILISILAGFSVDYVVHLAHAYVTTPGTSEERIAGSFGEMGVSVMSGMMTSILASLPLFFCQIVFFSSFGTFLCLTIAFSWVFANFFFMPLLATFGIMPSEGPCIPAVCRGGANVQESSSKEVEMN